MLGMFYHLQMLSMMYEDMYTFSSCFFLMIINFLIPWFSVNEIMAPQLKIGHRLMILAMIKIHDVWRIITYFYPYNHNMSVFNTWIFLKNMNALYSSCDEALSFSRSHPSFQNFVPTMFFSCIVKPVGGYGWGRDTSHGSPLVGI